ncbi:MAG: B12-binding domain-containing radical SAM protein [Betaproteobacteria bacterium RIFCSPHIGHO2_12_FULL_69_13]|nr:MAG: B12-binding domain-containing radical SAM protein [Betaproteobacteria bacterium RIFCSPHIGHO2_12_FULL_69_13]OGA68949.1 MAG: B12-binding domain-containing radical SAM protein [Betaproteobacteria bacterium RIFCSPLOWO2_12_FULL_68_20]
MTRVLLVNPRFPESFWSFRWALEKALEGKRELNPPLGLATLAALCPPDWEVRIVDENVEPLPLKPEADIVGVCGMGVQAARQKQLLRYYRGAGYHAVAGGSYASLCPEEYAGIADSVVAGESEYIWPRFCEDYARGTPQALYRETGNVDLADSPVPRFDLLRLERYATATVQLSRGCPFRCEFCDIIVMFGRRPRYKSAAQIGRELDALRALGARKVFFVDDNFIGNKARAKEVLRSLADYQERHGRRMRFGTEASLNLAADDELMRLMRGAGFEWVFLGLETPDAQTLREAGKTQNCAQDLLAAVRRIYAHGIDVLGGFIVGFDRDTPETFGVQERFIREAGIMVAMVGLLTALPKTPLYARLAREGRIVEGAAHGDNTKLATNIVPKSMSAAQMADGYRALYARLLCDSVIAERIRNKLRHFGQQAALHRERPLEAARIVWNLLRRGVARGGLARAWHFARSLPLARPRLLPLAMNDWIAALAMRDYADRHLLAAAAKEGAREWVLRISGRLDRAAVRRLVREARTLLADTQARLVLAAGELREAEKAELERLSRALARYGDRVAIVLGAGINELLRLEAARAS